MIQDEAFEFAVNFIKNQYEGWENIKDIKSTHGGLYIPDDFGCMIGGYHNGKKYSTDFIIVEHPGRKDVSVFPLQKVFNKARGTIQQELF